MASAPISITCRNSGSPAASACPNARQVIVAAIPRHREQRRDPALPQQIGQLVRPIPGVDRHQHGPDLRQRVIQATTIPAGSAPAPRPVRPPRSRARSARMPAGPPARAAPHSSNGLPTRGTRPPPACRSAPLDGPACRRSCNPAGQPQRTPPSRPTRSPQRPRWRPETIAFLSLAGRPLTGHTDVIAPLHCSAFEHSGRHGPAVKFPAVKCQGISVGVSAQSRPPRRHHRLPPARGADRRLPPLRGQVGRVSAAPRATSACLPSSVPNPASRRAGSPKRCR